MNEDLSDLDALAARPQRILHGLATPDDGDAAELAREVHAHVGGPRGGRDGLFSEGQQPQAGLHNQSDQPVGIENKVVLVGVLVAYDGMHPADLVVGGNDFQVGEHPFELRLLQLRADVLCDEVDCHDVVPPGPRDDDVSLLARRRHKLVKGRLHELGVLLNHAANITAPLANVPLDASRKPDIIVGVHKDLHVQQLPDALHMQHQDALKDDDIARLTAPELGCGPGVRLEVIHGNVHCLASLQVP
mmetsp:Transcript_22941/g.63670  ORF Transcript_22941/g.63670 Transcript_22941/m.63670 type:complete len:246 (-) Transcript_22941:667-1404(-)